MSACADWICSDLLCPNRHAPNCVCTYTHMQTHTQMHRTNIYTYLYEHVFSYRCIHIQQTDEFITFFFTILQPDGSLWIFKNQLTLDKKKLMGAEHQHNSLQERWRSVGRLLLFIAFAEQREHTQIRVPYHRGINKKLKEKILLPPE